MSLNLWLLTLLRARHTISLHRFVIFVESSGHICPNCYKLQAAKRANKTKVPVSQAQDPMILIGELVKALNLYSNSEVGNHSHVNKNSNARGASKKFWMQEDQSN